MTTKKAGPEGGVCVYPFSPAVAGTFWTCLWKSCTCHEVMTGADDEFCITTISQFWIRNVCIQPFEHTTLSFSIGDWLAVYMHNLNAVH